MRVHTLVIHHSAGPRGQTPEAIRRFHVEQRGWREVGYHYLIDAAGRIHVGREPHEVGAHAPPNRGRLGVCVIGDNTHRGDEWNPLQWQALADLVRACRTVWPAIRVVGHRDTKPTECPGLPTQEILREIGHA